MTTVFDENALPESHKTPEDLALFFLMSATRFQNESVFWPMKFHLKFRRPFSSFCKAELSPRRFFFPNFCDAAKIQEIPFLSTILLVAYPLYWSDTKLIKGLLFHPSQRRKFHSSLFSEIQIFPPFQLPILWCHRIHWCKQRKSIDSSVWQRTRCIGFRWFWRSTH